VKQNKEQKSLISDCDTRWGSTQAMVKRLLYMENEVKQVLVSDRKTAHLVPSWQDTTVLESFNDAMEPLAELTDIMSGSKYVTASCVSAMLQRLERQILAIKSSEGEIDSEDLLSNQLRQNVLNDLLPRYTSNETVLLLNVTSFLDPRFKARCLTLAEKRNEDNDSGDEFEHYSGHQSELNCVKNRLCEDYVSHMEEIESNDTPTEREESATVIEPCTGPTPSKRKKTVTLGSWLGHHNSESATASASLPHAIDHKEKISLEIELYAALPCSDYETNTLTWWRDHFLVYPALA
jgi:hypothetical protein